jgi:probable rRNA maturation factor
MRVTVANAQRAHRVPARRIGRVARHAARRLGIRGHGTLAITFVGPARMRRLHRDFLRDDSMTDVLTFRYPGEPTLGELVIAPAAARAYARRHGLSYEAELSRYVIHGLLHWKGHEDATPRQQARMRRREDQLLALSTKH